MSVKLLIDGSIKRNCWLSNNFSVHVSIDNFCFYLASGGDITETAIELAPLDHDNSHSRKRVSYVPP